MTGSLAEDKGVHVYNWTDYIDKQILADFEAETGIKASNRVFSPTATPPQPPV